MSVVLKGLALAVVAVAVFIATRHTSAGNSNPTGAKSVFEFTVDGIDNKPVSLASFKGSKAYLVVNVASQCGLTERNYLELQQVYEKYHDKGLEILAFPCNNFLGQEPAENSEILTYATETKGATFPVLGKLECDNGEKTHPLYSFLKSSISGGILGPGLKWNFAKFLCDKDGVPLKRFTPNINPWAMEKDIVEVLG